VAILGYVALLRARGYFGGMCLYWGYVAILGVRGYIDFTWLYGVIGYIEGTWL